ncbi:MAG: S9 family peptidase [Bacteroidales bacterium]|nr:S9 family peptidase [Bacteroidales bacterium]
MKLNILAAFIALLWLISMETNAQSSTKKSLNHTDYDSWKALSKPQISANGNWVSYEVNPQKGDGWLHLHNISVGMHDSIFRGQEALFSYSSDLLVFRIKQPEDSIRKLKLAKKKKDEMPKDSLGIWLLGKDSLYKSSGLKSFQLPKEGGSWIASLHEKAKVKEAEKDTLSKVSEPDSTSIETKEKPKTEKKKAKGAFNDKETYTLTLQNPLSGFVLTVDNVTESSFSKNGFLFAYITLTKDSIDTTSVHVFDTRSLQSRMILKQPGFASKPVSDDAGKQLAFLFTGDTSKVKRFSLQLWNEKLLSPIKVADTASRGIPNQWEVSENGKISFSEDGTKLYFETMPKVPQPVTDTLLDEEKVRVDVWNWQDNRLQTQQLKELEDDLKRSYLSVYRIPDKKIIQLADTLITQVRTIKKGNGELALGFSSIPYLLQTSWENNSYKDAFLLDLKTGIKKKTLVKKGFTVNLSPEGKYLIWYEGDEKIWYLMDLIKSQIRNISQSVPFAFYEEDHDVPSTPGPYGIAGWTTDDASVLIYDKYDIWQFDPKGLKGPVNLTNGRAGKVIHRYVNLDPEALSINPASSVIIKTVEEESRKQGFSSLIINQPGSLKYLSEADAEYTNPIKAKLADELIWQRSTYTQYPDLWTSKLDFSEVEKLSITNPQQSSFWWGTVEAVSWTSLEGISLKGLLYKPENFSDTAKYPMIVYFYEKYSEAIHSHYVPNPSRSTVNFPFYNSNGYLVFIPDIHYTTGQPGEDAYICIMSGVLEMMKRPYVDTEHMGIQGQSWGGYQVAYLVTRTGLFKAAMSGAPVSNMTSAYGGIRWESGLVRQFQYEQGQSRIGNTLWENRELYLKNSPVFFADKVTTPLLIMSNDNDGAVPWQQGIELFTALRRLGKPSWLLNYNGDEHNLTKRPNRMDLAIRMNQFFDHYLKDKPMPLWMSKGIPAIKKGKEFGYEPEE